MSAKALGTLMGSQVIARVLVLNVMNFKKVCASREAPNLMTNQYNIAIIWVSGHSDFQETGKRVYN